jgi:phosphopantothenoylcysteine decarboxylase/phosphopantothenate--cysteine ligase
MTPGTTSIDGRELVVGVTGGIAAYKTAALVSQLVQAGAGVTVVMTRSAHKFIGRATFEALTGRKVATRVFDDADHPLGAHIDLATRGELLVVAPATANFLAKAAHGLADDLLSTLVLAWTGKIVVAPAMNCEMWEKPSVQRNVAQLRSDGYVFIDPEEGWLSCRRKGVGRMAAPEKILAVIVSELTADSTPRA